MHILHGKKIEQPIEKLSESFLDLSLNWAAVGELKNGGYSYSFVLNHVTFYTLNASFYFRAPTCPTSVS